MVLSHNPAIPLPGFYSKDIKTQIWKNICTPMFIVTLFTKAKTWITEQRSYGIIYSKEYYSTILNDELIFYGIMVRIWGDYAKWNQSRSDRQLLDGFTHFWNINNSSKQTDKTIELLRLWNVWWLFQEKGKWGGMARGDHFSSVMAPELWW